MSLKEGDTGGRKKVIIDEFDEKALSRHIMSYHKRSPPQLPTLDKIHADSRAISEFPEMGHTSLHSLIKRLDFVCKKRNAKMQVYQRMDVVAQRHKVLRALPDYRARGYEVFYQDESFVNGNHTRQYVWQNENYEKDARDDIIKDTKWYGGLSVPSGKGQRIIINHIGSKNGFLEGARECFVGEKRVRRLPPRDERCSF